ncbi:MAG: phage tail sheath family protein [Myxococcales bacterium]|nr:MAG: phage tail sheath family protein [Myxococcales bacterium]
MPSALTYPGVYIEEIPSGVRTITGVATSIAAFVGRTRRGPVDEPIVITSYGDFERRFGGLWFTSPMTYAVRDFFANGGAQAVIVRGFKAQEANDDDDEAEVDPSAGKASIAVDEALTLQAVSQGAWANDLRVRIDHQVAPGDDSLFNLSVGLVRYGTNGKVAEVAELEVFRNLSLREDHRRRVDNVLKAESKLIVTDGFAPSDEGRPAASAAPDAEHELWGKNEGNETSIGVADEAQGFDGVALDQQALSGDTAKGIYALERADLFNLLCIPPHDRATDIENQLIEDAVALCKRRRALLLIDPPRDWVDRDSVVTAVNASTNIGTASANAALFFPRIRRPDPARPTVIADFAPCGMVAGVMARTDVERGVWKAPAGLAATLVGAPSLSVKLTEGDIGLLNPIGVNCLRSMPNIGHVVWGSRTREGADLLASEWKYIPVRRLTLFIEESLYRGTQWVVFEPNDEPLWGSIRLNVGAFMHSLFRQGAFQGATARQAYEVKCDSETTTQDDINRGVVNIVVRFAPLKPAEFVVIKIQQLAGQVQA